MGDAADSSELYVLRRIHRDHFRSHQPLEVDPAAFRPSNDDRDGLSVSFENEISAEQLAASARQPPENYAVVRLPVSELEQLGLTIQRDTGADAPPGHAFIQEINILDYASDRETKRKLKELGFKMAALASQNVVRHPRFDDE